MMKPFFSIPDPDLAQESSVDPMGIQPIWTYYGQQIFNQRITTIANDLRIFTFNIFHHHIIQELGNQYSDDLQQARQRYKSWKTEYDVKAGLLIFLEDLVTWVFYLDADRLDTDIEKIGILGLNKARRIQSTFEESKIYLVASKSAGLLKNQINLGMTGRYKGPMMSMGFFDRSLTYLPNSWNNVNKLFGRWEEAKQLEKAILKLLVKQLLQSTGKEHPRLSLSEIRSSRLWRQISTGYLGCLGQRKLKRDLRSYWVDQIGLNSGASKALFESVTNSIRGEELSYKAIFIKAKRELKNEPIELKKVEQILTIESFLSHSEYLLRYLSQPFIKNLKDVKNELQIIRNSIKEQGKFTTIDIFPRLTELQNVMLTDGDLEEWLKKIIYYHTKIMTMRGGTAWLSIDEKGSIKHYFGGALSKEFNDVKSFVKSDFWYHTYYIETLRTISMSMH